MAAFQYKLIWFGCPLGSITVVGYISKRNQPAFLHGRLDDFQIWLYVPAAHPWA